MKWDKREQLELAAPEAAKPESDPYDTLVRSFVFEIKKAKGGEREAMSSFIGIRMTLIFFYPFTILYILFIKKKNTHFFPLLTIHISHHFFCKKSNR